MKKLFQPMGIDTDGAQPINPPVDVEALYATTNTVDITDGPEIIGHEIGDNLEAEVLAAVEQVDPPRTQVEGHVAFLAKVAGYDTLADVLKLAYMQSAAGKGKERHSVGAASTKAKPFDKQPIMEIGRMVGPGYQAGQVQKKVQEAITMAGKGNVDAAQAEVLGAIVYAAALWQLLEESK